MATFSMCFSRLEVLKQQRRSFLIRCGWGLCLQNKKTCWSSGDVALFNEPTADQSAETWRHWQCCFYSTGATTQTIGTAVAPSHCYDWDVSSAACCCFWPLNFEDCSVSPAASLWLTGAHGGRWCLASVRLTVSTVGSLWLASTSVPYEAPVLRSTTVPGPLSDQAPVSSLEEMGTVGPVRVCQECDSPSEELKGWRHI